MLPLFTYALTLCRGGELASSIFGLPIFEFFRFQNAQLANHYNGG